MVKFAVVVSSCDVFCDCWEPFLFSISKYWKDIPFNVYFISNNKELKDSRACFIKVGEDKGWASNLKRALTFLDAEYILYLQEDYWLTRTVSTKKILSHLAYCENNGVDYLRLNIPFNDKEKLNENYAQCPIEHDKYAICLQASIWKKSTLERLLIDGWSGWDYEAKACQYARDNQIPIKSEVVLSNADKDFILWYVDGTAVRKGKWTRAGVTFLKENGFDNLVNKRRIEGRLIGLLAQWRNIPFLHLPSSALIRIINRLKWNI